MADNGSGVSRDNYDALATKYATSKISGFEDLEGVQTFGFRGEALSSLCALADVSVVTRTAQDEVRGAEAQTLLSLLPLKRY